MLYFVLDCKFRRVGGCEDDLVFCAGPQVLEDRRQSG
jgi:hypothetical protein